MSWFKRKTKWWIGLLVLSLLLLSTSVAWAGEPDPGIGGVRRRPVLRGEVTAIDGTTLSVKTPRGEVTVLTDEHTRFRLPGVEDPGVDDLEIGEIIGAAGDSPLHRRASPSYPNPPRGRPAPAS
jgi:hypothetical protein